MISPVLSLFPHPRPALPAPLLHQPQLGNHHSAIDALAHVVNGQKGRARRHQGLHFHARAVVNFGLGLDFDPDKSWDEKKEVYRLSNRIVRTQNVTQTAVGDKQGLWTTVVAAAVIVG